LVSWTGPPNLDCSVAGNQLVCFGRDGFELAPYTQYLLTVIVNYSTLSLPATLTNRTRLNSPKPGECVDQDWETITIYPPPPIGGGGGGFGFYFSWNFSFSFGGCPFDPNEKQVSPSDFVTVDTTLRMAIYYENIGTAPAEDIYITDTLEHRFDEYTLRNISDGGVYNPISRTIIWELKGVYLQPGEEGFVSFEIMPRKDTQPGVFLYNHATIIFDTQSPIDTPIVPIYIGPPPEIGVSGLLEYVRDQLIIKRDGMESVTLKNKGSIVAKLNAAISSVSSAIGNLENQDSNLAQNNIYTTINELNALIDFISSQEGKIITTEIAREAYEQLGHLIFLLNLAKLLLEGGGGM